MECPHPVGLRTGRRCAFESNHRKFGEVVNTGWSPEGRAGVQGGQERCWLPVRNSENG